MMMKMMMMGVTESPEGKTSPTSAVDCINGI